ncbi:MAG: 3',5'-cyclic-AMP phosphodiesterase [Methylococcaceae bacterium]|nr:3',5'-cyclic-AMP phosphodiesterase [Methylococcaceae bacterium]
MLNHEPLAILQLTDTHIMASSEDTLLGVNTAYYFKAVLESVIHSGRKFDLCLVTGDIAQDPVISSYQYLLKQLERLDIPCICLPGNHDDLEIMRQVFSTDTINCRKQLITGQWQIIALNSQVPDSAGGYVSDGELTFLENCLENNKELNALIAVHHHSVPTGSSWMDTMIIENARSIFDILDKYPNAKAVINGHIHQEMDIQLNACRILTTPSTCFQFKPLSDHFSLDDTSPGYRWLHLYENGLIDSGIVRIPEKISGLRTNNEGY